MKLWWKRWWKSTEQVDASTLLLASAGDDGEAVCYLCLDGGADEADHDQPLRRDCACRGTDAGFVHLSCLTNYAETKSIQAHSMQEFVNPWIFCPSCHHEYQNEFAVNIVNKFVSFLRRQYPDDTKRQVESVYLKLTTFNSMLYRLKPVHQREAGDTANVLLSLIDQMKTETSPLPMRYSRCEANAYHVLGRIAYDEGTEESARRAVLLFESQLELNASIGYDEGVANAKTSIAIAKSR